MFTSHFPFFWKFLIPLRISFSFLNCMTGSEIEKSGKWEVTRFRRFAGGVARNGLAATRITRNLSCGTNHEQAFA
jgi:hypothetical protein